LLGCGSSSPGTVSGKVYLKDKPLKGGNVTFLTADKKVSQIAKIGEDGSYTIGSIPAGPVKIAVETKSLKQVASVPRNAPPPGQKAPNSSAADPKELMKRYVPIPDKYADAGESGLEYTVKSGKQDYDIKLP
jgi:hypothetical protein